MAYSLGIDLGTTYTAAAVTEGGRSSIIDLSSQTATIPSVIFLAEDGGYLVGDAASRRSLMDPARAAKQFKRRFGDTTPIFLGGTPISADQLTAQLLKAVVAAAIKQQGGEPDHITITHPANWGGYKLELLEQSIRAAGLDGVTTLTEPEAAVLHYSQQERVSTGSIIAVFDLGGGTFDAAVIRKTDEGTEFLGRPEGIERLGGIDFDQAIYAFVADHLDGALDDLDIDDPTTRSALERLRSECIGAKEALSADEVAEIPVLLPTLQTTVRITRSEFEALIRPAVAQAIDALNRALKSADLEASSLDAVLLAGGSSRIPLISEMVGGTLARPVAVDSHPKHVVALGAAMAASAHAVAGGAAGAVAATGAATAAAGAAATAAAATAAAAAAAATTAIPAVPPTPTEPMPVQPVAAAATTAMPQQMAAAAPPVGSPSEPLAKKSSKTPMYAAAAVVALLAVGGVGLALAGGSDGDANGVATTDSVAADEIAAPVESAPATEVASDSTLAPETTIAPDTTVAETTTTVPPTTLPFPADTRRVGLTGLVNTGASYEVSYEPTNFVPSFDAGQFHMHFFWNTFAPESVGVGASPQGDWAVWVSRPDGSFVFDAFGPATVPAGATEICAVVATADHAIDAPEFVNDTVSCLPL